MDDFSAANLAIIAAIFVLAGLTKGVIGLGLPTVALGLSTAVVGLDAAIQLMVVPSLATNLWQGAVGGRLRPLLVRFWPMLALVVIGTLAGGYWARGLDAHGLSALLGGLIGVYGLLGLLGLLGPAPRVSPGVAKATGPIVGAVNGVLTGLTGSFVVPGVMFMQAVGLSRDELIQAIGVLFTVSTAALMAAVLLYGRGTAQLGMMSVAALVPAAVGMVVGMRVRRRLSEAVFRRVFFVSLVLLGLHIVGRALL